MREKNSHEEISNAKTGVAGSGRRIRRDGGELHAATGAAVCGRVGNGEGADLRPPAEAPHFAPKAKRVIFIYIGGGPSTIDMFDPKPALMKYDGKPAPFEIKGRALNGSQQIMASPWKFAECGESGRQVSDLLPYFQKVVDKVTFVRSMTTDRIDHSTAQFTFVTGRGFTGFPSIGSWVSYALGTREPESAGVHRAGIRARRSATGRIPRPGCRRSSTARRCAPIRRRRSSTSSGRIT